MLVVTVWPDKHEISGRRRLNAGPTSTTLTHHRTSPDQTPLPDIIIHTEVGPSNDHQLSVDDLINLFTNFNDYMSILIITIITIIINTFVMHDIYLKTTRVIHNRNNFDFLSFHAASTNFDRFSKMYN